MLAANPEAARQARRAERFRAAREIRAAVDAGLDADSGGRQLWELLRAEFADQTPVGDVLMPEALFQLSQIGMDLKQLAKQRQEDMKP